MSEQKPSLQGSTSTMIPPGYERLDAERKFEPITIWPRGFEKLPEETKEDRDKDRKALFTENLEMIYLASPYSDPDPAVRKARYEAACRYVAGMMKRGSHVFSPVAYSHPIAELCGLPLDWTFWQEFDRAWLERCAVLVVLRLDGWEQSKGVAAEVALAREMGKPVVYSDMPAEKIVVLDSGLVAGDCLWIAK